MQFSLLFLIAAAASASAIADEAPKLYPVTRVVELLKDMSKQLSAEQEQDEEIYEKLACWCETNDKAKTKAIADAEAKISDLGAKVESLSASSERLNAEIENLNKEIEGNQQALDVATALREKQLAEFNAEEKEMLLSIQALGQAVVVLSKHHGKGAAAALQVIDAVKLVNDQLHRHKALLQGVITPSQRQIVGALLQEPADFSKATPTFKQAYKPQSGQIFGILNQMKETFEADLADSQREEQENQAAYKELKAAKENEIAAGKESLEDKTQQLASVDEKNAQAKQDLDDTTNALGADQKFLMELKEHCSMTDKEWEARQKTRQGEIAAVNQAIAVLTADDARDTFSRTFNAAAFLQREAEAHAQSRKTAAELLTRVAVKTGSAQLAQLATTVSLDSFTRVKKAIDAMVAELLAEKADEIKHKDFCVNNLHENQVEQERTEREKELTERTIDGLKISIQSLTNSIASLKAEISDLAVQLKRASEDRAMEHKDFQGIVADQRETQQILSKALTVLKDFYNAEASLVQNAQRSVAQKQAPPPGFDEYQKQGSTGVVMLLEQIIADAKALEAETVHDEEQAQKAHEKFVKESNASMEEKKRSVVNQQADKAKAEKDLNQAQSDLEGAESTLEGLAVDLSALNKSCDFVLKNFEARQQARDEEVEALRQAKAILSGMKLE